MPFILVILFLATVGGGITAIVVGTGNNDSQNRVRTPRKTPKGPLRACLEPRTSARVAGAGVY